MLSPSFKGLLMKECFCVELKQLMMSGLAACNLIHYVSLRMCGWAARKTV